MEKSFEVTSGTELPIGSTNIGFKLLKKHGWKEGTGLGAFEQGRLEPVEAHLKKNKRGIGSEEEQKSQKKKADVQETAPKMSKKASKKMRKMLELEKKLKEKEFERAFYREFWPDNV